MARLWLIGLVSLALALVHVQAEDLETLEDLKKQLERAKNVTAALTRQTMMNQLYQEESMRSTGDSGIKQQRTGAMGTRPYFTWDHTGNQVMAIHDHANNAWTQGLGEFIAVLNGVEFRTRHNDYKLQMPHETSAEYHKVQNLPMPPVPPEVLEKPTAKEQISEMRHWFKSFQNGWSGGARDYRKYFWPTLCYMEGFWTTGGEKIDESFESDRHFIDASSWWDLTEKVRYTAYTGSKDNKENYAFLPMKIINLINNDTEPVFAQWNYRILCAPIDYDLRLHHLRVIDDLSSRMAKGRTLEEHKNSRAARFEIYKWGKDKTDKEKSCGFCLLDELMEQIPGLDNYQANLTDNSFGQTVTHFKTNKVLNTGFYHRRYKVLEKGAMGTLTRSRGFADRNVFMAQTSQERVPELTVASCEGSGKNEVCHEYASRWTYAIPLEIVYRTPLWNWNPYNIEDHGSSKKNEGYQAVTAGGRNGQLTPEKAYNGTRNNLYFRTPAEFFTDGEIEGDAADTSGGTVGVLDKDGNMRAVVASGSRIFFPEITGVGLVRQRYPIAPLHNDGNQIYKELEALKDVVMRMQTYQKMLKEIPNFGDGESPEPEKHHEFQMVITAKDPPGMHTHFLSIPGSEMEEMITKGSKMNYETTENNGHSHILDVKYDAAAKNGPWVIATCDGKTSCWDGHDMYLQQLN